MHTFTAVRARNPPQPHTALPQVWEMADTALPGCLQPQLILLALAAVSFSILHSPELFIHCLLSSLSRSQEQLITHQPSHSSCNLTESCPHKAPKQSRQRGVCSSLPHQCLWNQRGLSSGPHGCVLAGRKHLQGLCIQQKHKEKELKQWKQSSEPEAPKPFLSMGVCNQVQIQSASTCTRESLQIFLPEQVNLWDTQS